MTHQSDLNPAPEQLDALRWERWEAAFQFSADTGGLLALSGAAG